jgi:hypothetical protein
MLVVKRISGQEVNWVHKGRRTERKEQSKEVRGMERVGEEQSGR